MFDPDYTGKEGLVFRMPWVGIWVDHLVTIGFWSLLFATFILLPATAMAANDLTDAMELTTSRRNIQLCMSSARQIAARRALARGSSSCSR